MSDRDKIQQARCDHLASNYGKTSVSNIKAHLRIVHRRRLRQDVSMGELRRVWLAFHTEGTEDG